MPRGMGEIEFKLWGDRLDHADEVWSDHGLLYDSSLKSVYALLDAYRGQQWPMTGRYGLMEDDLVVTPSFYATVNTFLAQLSARNPKANILPRNPDSRDSARIVEAIVNYYIMELKMRREFNRALRDSLFLPVGIIRHGFTPRAETYDEEGNLLDRHTLTKPDLPWIRAMRLWDVRIDPLATSFDGDGDARWCAFRSLMLKHEIENNPNIKMPRDLKPSQYVTEKVRRTREMRDEEGPDARSVYEVWTVYDKVERKWFQMSRTSEQLLREPSDWPIPWEGLPIDVLYFNEQCDDPFPVPPLEGVLRIAKERNMNRTMMAQLVKRLRRLVLLRKGALDKEEREKLFESESISEFIETDAPPSEAMAQVTVGGFSQDLLAYDSLLREDIREHIGQSLMDRAQRINVETASEASFVQAGSDTQKARTQTPFEEFLGSVIANFTKGLQSTLTDELVVPIVGMMDARTLMAKPGMPFLRATPEMIQGEFLYTIEVGSTLPRDKQAQVQEAIGWLSLAEKFPQNINIPQALADVALALDKDPDKALTTVQEQQAAMQGLAQQGVAPTIETPPGNIDPRAFAGANGGGGGTVQ